MAYMDVYYIQQVEFLDDKGWFSEDWQLSTFLKESPESYGFAAPRSLDNIQPNYLSQGRVFYQDLY
jgi:hypothetical protein